MIYEWRIYEVVPGKMDLLNDRFEKYWNKLFKKYGIKVIGYWTTIIGKSNLFYYMLAYDSMAHREECFKSLLVDPDLTEVRARLNKEQGLVHTHVTNILLQPTSYSPLK